MMSPEAFPIVLVVFTSALLFVWLLPSKNDNWVLLRTLSSVTVLVSVVTTMVSVCTIIECERATSQYQEARRRYDMMTAKTEAVRDVLLIMLRNPNEH